MVIPHIRWLMGWIRGQPGLLSLHSTPLPLIEKLTFARIVIQDMMLIIVPGWLYVYYYCWWGVVMFIHEWQCCCVNTARLSYGNTTLVSLKQLPPESLHGCGCTAHPRQPDNVYSLPPGKVNVGLHLHLGRFYPMQSVQFVGLLQSATENAPFCLRVFCTENRLYLI